MKNRAKCKLCNSIIQSTMKNDFVTCKCGEIALDGGYEYIHANIRTCKSNLIIVDDEGNEIIPKQMSYSVPKKEIKEEPIELPNLTKEEWIQQLEEIVKIIEEMPQHAQLAPVTHSDFCTLLKILSSALSAF